MRKLVVLGVLLLAEGLFMSQGAQADRSIEFISQQRVSQMEKAFNASSPINLSESRQLNESSWICSLIGTNTRMQKVDGAQLYSFSISGNELKNRGAQVIKSYSVKGGELIGSNLRVEDKIRKSNNGRLIAQIKSVKSPQAVVAYANCSKI